jgi:soluble lytic murein transglycosylase-like protein
VPVELLAAQLYTESNFNPFAVSRAGAKGLAQFTPGTANAYGLRDPFDGAASIEAQAHLMHELLAAQLYAESNFNPFAVSGAGAQGLAQFTPGTAKAYGLQNPFDGESSIEAQAHLMHDLLTRYKTAALALAAYNAGSGAVDRFHGIPPFAETQGYVTRVLGLMSGAGAIGGSFLGVRLVA